jgi:8-oxo-dGTP pyrophosphatase MutT (NUDIX family)
MPDLFKLVPALKHISHPLLLEREITVVGVSAVLYDEEAYYFEIAKPRHWGTLEDETRAVGIGGIGGRIEPGESILACLRREIREELSVPFQLESTEHTMLIHQGEVIDQLDLPTSRRFPAPYFVNLMPPQLGGPGMPDHLAIVTFLGRLRRRPKRQDLFGLLTIAAPVLEEFFAREEWPLEEALAHPSLTFELKSDLPVGCILRPTLTARAFQALLRHRSATA